MPGPLPNIRHERFAQGLAGGLTADAAYEAAGYKAHRGNASRMSTDENIRARVDEIVGAGAEQAVVTVERALRESAIMALYDPKDIASTPMSGPEDIANLPEDVRRAIVGWSWDRQGNFVLKLANKTAALDQIYKVLGAYTEHVKIDATIDINTMNDDQVREEIARQAAALARAGVDIASIMKAAANTNAGATGGAGSDRAAG